MRGTTLTGHRLGRRPDVGLGFTSIGRSGGGSPRRVLRGACSVGDGQWSLLGLLARARRATSMASTGSWMLPPRARSRASPGLSRRESAPDCREVEVGVHVEVEGAVRVDVGPEQGREGSTVIVGQALGPL